MCTCHVFCCYWASVDSKTLAELQTRTAVQMECTALFVCLVQRKGNVLLEAHCNDSQKNRDNLTCQSKMRKIYLTPVNSCNGRSTSVSLLHILIPVCHIPMICHASSVLSKCARDTFARDTFAKLCNLRLSLGTKTMRSGLAKAWWSFKCDTGTLVSWMKVVWPSNPLGTSLHHLFVIWYCCRWLYLASTLSPCASLPPHIS